MAVVGPGATREGVRPPAGKPAAPPPASDWSRRAAGRFYVAVFLSVYGDWLTTIALLVVLFQLTKTPAGPAAYVLFRVAPRVAGPWLGGVLTDRYSPRTVMTTSAVIQAAFVAALIPATRTGALAAIFLSVAAAQFVGALARPSQGSMLPRLVSDDALPRANAVYWLIFSSSVFVAPAIGALLLARVGPAPLFAIDAATFTVSALLFSTLSPAGSQSHARPDANQASPHGAGGLRLAFRDPVVRGVAAANFASGLTVTVVQAVLVVAAHERYGGDSAVGFLYAAVGIGGTLGGMIALKFVPPRAWVRAAVFSITVLELIALASFTAVSALSAALILLGVSSWAGSSFDIWGGTEVQRRAPPGAMGRFNSTVFIAMYSGMLLGAVWALSTSSVFHWDVEIEIACAGMLALLGAVWLVGRQSSVAPHQKEP